MEGILTGTTNPGQSGPESNGNDGVNSRTGASSSDAVYCHTQNTVYINVCKITHEM